MGDIRSEEFLTTDELAALLKIKKATLRDMRYRGTAPRAVKVGQAVRYRLSDVEAWLDAQAEPQPA